MGERIDSLYLDGPSGGKGSGKGKPGRTGTPSGNEPDDSGTIPKQFLGRVIGRQGSTIKQIIAEFDLDDMKAKDVGQDGIINFMEEVMNQENVPLKKYDHSLKITLQQHR